MVPAAPETSETLVPADLETLAASEILAPVTLVPADLETLAASEI